MIIKDLFVKPIDRDLQGVIVVGQENEKYVQQELEEYVVTKELQKHFRDFFANYKKGIIGTTPKMGVWISGFFGSGKSHFLKILSYLLENKEVSGKRALDYFIDDHKIDDSAVLADMKLATQTGTDVISFNIASKSDNSGNQNKDAIINVFLRVFNEMQGFCGAIPWVADLERKLTEKGQYEEFKQKFAELSGEDWETSRDDFDYIQDDIAETLVAIEFMSDAAAQNWCEKAMNEHFSLSIEDFAKGVKSYLRTKEANHHIVFLIDEVGQYIGDDSQLMLDLQTVTEELGTQCQGKVWIVVTSQQDIDAVTSVRGNDFSKIQGRFDTRLSLSSANVDAIIKKRILEKTNTAQDTLHLVYEQEETTIKNLITFNDTVEKKLYANGDDFSEVYPFIPYQFNLLASVLNSIRTHGASGKHLSEGERSMLAMFKEAAMAYASYDINAIIPLHTFYNALENFLDHSHRGVIIKAYENSIINPDEKKNSVFAIDVLKTLFLIKYVDMVTANIDNLTTLMISNIHDDRINLKNQVAEALKVLMSQNLVQKNGDVYVFLTNEEQEINREIQAEEISQNAVVRKAGELIFEDILKDNKYTYPKFKGRYVFDFDQRIDDQPYNSRNTTSGLSVHVFTPQADVTDSDLALKSLQEQSVIIRLPADQAFMDELSMHLKIEKFLQHNTSSKAASYGDIKSAKEREMRDRLAFAKTLLEDNLKTATIYVNGNMSEISAKEISTRMNEAMGKLVQNVYNKLSYIDTPMEDSQIKQTLHIDTDAALEVSTDSQANAQAVQEVERYIAENTSPHGKLSMKTLKEYFMKAPYGFVENDVEWIVAWLFRRGNLSLFLNGAAITYTNQTEAQLFDYITKKQYMEQLVMERREHVSDSEKRVLRKVMKELFDHTVATDDEDSLIQNFKEKSADTIDALEKLSIYYNQADYPGKAVVEDGLSRLTTLNQKTGNVKEFFAAIKTQQEDLLDLADALSEVKNFFKGKQKEYYHKALQTVHIYDKSKVYILDENIENAVAQIQRILDMPSPYGQISKLPELVDTFNTLYVQLLDKETKPVQDVIAEEKEQVLDVLSGKSYDDKEQKKADYIARFDELTERAKRSQNIAEVRSFKDQADTLKLRLLNDMDLLDQKLAGKAKQSGSDDPSTSGTTHDPSKPYVPKRTRRISIKSVVTTSAWHIQSQDDVDRYINGLREKLLDELREDTEINIEF